MNTAHNKNNTLKHLVMALLVGAGTLVGTAQAAVITLTTTVTNAPNQISFQKTGSTSGEINGWQVQGIPTFLFKVTNTNANINNRIITVELKLEGARDEWEWSDTYSLTGTISKNASTYALNWSNLTIGTAPNEGIPYIQLSFAPLSVVGQAEGSINPIFSSWLPSANSLGGSSESNPDNLNTPNNLVTAVPEPGMLALFGAGLLGAMGFLRRRRAI